MVVQAGAGAPASGPYVRRGSCLPGQSLPYISPAPRELLHASHFLRGAHGDKWREDTLCTQQGWWTGQKDTLVDRNLTYLLKHIHTHTRCIGASKMSSRCCNALQPFWFIRSRTVSLHCGFAITPPHTQSIRQMDPVIHGFHVQNWVRTLANGCFENRSITVQTWSDGFHIQLWGVAIDRTRKRPGESGGRAS